MRRAIIVSALLLASIPAFAGEGGSGGVTGGGDQVVSVYDLLPSKLEIRAVYDFPRGTWKAFRLPDRRFGIETWAHEVEARLSMTQDQLIAGATLPRLELRGKYKGIYREIRVREVRVDAFGFVNFETELGGGHFRLMELSAGQTWKRPKSVEIHWDAKKLAPREFAREFEKVSEIVVNQLDFTVPEAITSAEALQRYRSALSFNSLEEPMLHQLQRAIIAGGDEVKKAALAVEAGGKCDAEAYARLLSKVKSWTLGTPSFFARIKSEYGWDLGRYTANACSETRREANGLALEVIVRCADAAGTAGDRERIELILKEM